MMNNREKQQITEEQIKRRVTVLKKWVASGIPSDYNAPASLQEARIWDAFPDLGIKPIGSEETFRKNHPRYGAMVNDIDALIKELRTPGKKKSEKDTTRKDLKEARIRIKGLEEATVGFGNQMHEMIANLEGTERALRLAQAKIIFLENENEKLRARFSDSKKSSKVVRANFSKVRQTET